MAEGLLIRAVGHRQPPAQIFLLGNLNPCPTQAFNKRNSLPSPIAVGCAGYVITLFPFPLWSIILMTVFFSGVIAAWGIVESIRFAAVLTLIEVMGLIVVVVAGLWQQPEVIQALPSVFPALTDTPALAAIAMTSLLAFFAFIGFDGMVNVVEETKNPARNMPLGIFITLTIATFLYFSVAAIAVLLLAGTTLTVTMSPCGV